MSSASTEAGTSNNKWTTEELRRLKEGDVIVGEDGKKYRAKKTILPQHAISGPHGIGDPSDRTLRKVETDILIPNMMNKRIEKVECRAQIELLVACMRREGAAMGLRQCTGERDILNECKSKMFNDPRFRQRVTEEYLSDRSAARQTGMSAKQRSLQAYRDWKVQNPEAAAAAAKAATAE